MSNSRSRRTHSFGGCKTCRKRHLKCDQSVPKCNRCRLAGLACEGFTPALRWLISTGPEVYDKQPSQPAETGPQQFSRRHLYTEQGRKSMSSALINGVPSTVTAALSEIEEESKTLDIEDRAPSTFSIGPFQVFKFESEPCTSMGTAISDSVSFNGMDIDDLSEDRSQGYSEPAGFDLTKSTFSNDFATSSLDFLQWGDLFTWDVSILDNPPLLSSFNPSQDSIDTLPINLNWPAESNVNFSEALDPMLSLDTCATDLAWPQMDMIVDAPLLLKHFNDDVISQMGSLPINEKSAWRTLHYPSAVMTMSQLTVLDTNKDQIKHANLAIFYALIAVSAFHLSLNSTTFPALARPGDHWKCLSNRTYDAAKHHLKLSLEKECQPPNKAKYKEQLMGISSVLATALLSGNEGDTRWCLTEMERLISWRGLTKPSISRRARLLHNVYAWMRIVSESTNVYRDENHAIEAPFARSNASSSTTKPPQTNTVPVQSINPDITLDNFLHLEPRKLHPSHGQKESRRDIKDIHLADTFQDQENMYMQIYGVPETWLSLVSQITRLANVMDRLSTRKKSDAEVLVSLQPRASYLENAVCLFRSRHEAETDAASSMSPVSLTSAPGGTPHMHMVRALGSALVIFFYRRIRNVNPLVLQDSVNDVVNFLHAFDDALEQNGLLGPGTAWPAFIAGAEAMSIRQRQHIAAWLEKGFNKSGFESYRVSKEVLTEVWRRRDESEGAADFSTWMDDFHTPTCLFASSNVIPDSGPSG
ncbi:arginine metabolism regulation ii [Fusarium albosuccineum]|uniref:Arginine metabolism regulation ii n=1 Tax=Fusarium albosuccineum TaxID=1237068 RepID=A0A8H4NW74_9HYPO|nr:arginine metabolism regulation ii [Fusarium albosuccineum]